MKKLSTVGTLVVILALAACASQKAPAEAAVKAAEDGYNAISSEAIKYVPEQARSIQNELTAAKGALAKEDYPAALTQAQALPARISALGTAIAARKAELTQAWTTLSAGVPQLVSALKGRVDGLAKTKAVPKGLTKETVEGAKAGLASATAMWNDAAAAAQSGDMAAATAKATEVKDTVVGLMKSLNMQIPDIAGIR